MKKKCFIVIGLFFIALSIDAQSIKRPDSYNYQRGIEALREENTESALEFFNKDIAENPKSGYQYMWLSYIYLYTDEYGRALDAANQAIQYLPKEGCGLWWSEVE